MMLCGPTLTPVLRLFALQLIHAARESQIGDAAYDHKVEDLRHRNKIHTALEHVIRNMHCSYTHVEYQRDQGDERLDSGDDDGPAGPPEYQCHAGEYGGVIGCAHCRAVVQESDTNIDVEDYIKQQEYNRSQIVNSNDALR